MSTGNAEPRDAAELRRQAEAHVRNLALLPPSAPTHEESQRVLHELRVHQVELEMQNEELRRAQAEIEAGRERYYDLYDLAPVGYCTLSEQGLILEANRTAATLLGTPRDGLRQRPLSHFIVKDDQDCYYRHRERLFEPHLTGPGQAAEAQECELRLVKADGTVFWAHLTATAAHAEDGAPLCRLVLADISARKRTEEALREERERLEKVLSATRTGIDIVDGDFNLWFVDRGWQAVYGDPTGRKCYEYFNGLSAPCPGCGVLRALATQQAVVTEEVLSREGNRPIEVRSIPFQNADGQWLVAEVNTDITERKRVEAALRESEARFRSYIEHAPYGVFVTDGQGRYVDANPAAERISGYSAAQLTAMGVPDLLAAESRESGLEQFQTLVATGRLSTELGFRRADGSRGYWSVSATRLGPDRYLGFVEDITERQDREARLALLGRMLDEAPAAITIHDDEGRFLFSNRHNVLLHGYASEAEFLSVNLHEIDRPASAALLAERFRQIAETGSARFEVAHYRKDGSTLPLEVTARVIAWRGQPAVLSIAMDTTERKQAEEALKASDRRFKELLQNVPTVAVQGYALDGTVRYWNRASETFYGYTAAEALGRNLLDLIIPPAMRDAALALVRRMVETGEPIPTAEVELMRQDGSLIPVYSSHALVQLPEQEAELFCIDIDLTELRQTQAEREKLQAEFLQAQKMESVGRLAGGVAHDFNNLLMGIMNYAELCREGVAAEHSIRPWLDEITAESQRSANLVRQLLAFARKQTVQPRALDLNEQIGGMLKMLGRLIGERIELSWSPAANLRIVSADPSHIDQVMANLCVNAADAIAGNGRIAIATRNLAMDEMACAGMPGMTPGAYVLLTVADSGCGMDADTLAHAFEPFFTTKGVGRGTGLGLATVYGIVKQSDGFVGVDSAPGAGTTFRIYLPAIDGPDTAAAPLVDAGPPPGGSETILVVDDEKSIRVTTTARLERLGYIVLMADGPETALRLAREHAGAIDLLLSDMVMPGMSGVELRERLLPECPGLKTIFITGYTTAELVEPAGKGTDTLRLTKPIALLDLAIAIRAMLGDGRAPTT